MSEPERNLYHEHLDRCRWCREHPFNLCHDGSDALVAEVNKTSLLTLSRALADGTSEVGR